MPGIADTWKLTITLRSGAAVEIFDSRHGVCSALETLHEVMLQYGREREVFRMRGYARVPDVLQRDTAVRIGEIAMVDATEVDPAVWDKETS